MTREPPDFTEAEEAALQDLSISAGCATGDREGHPRLSADGVRYVLAVCQADGGDPAKVYRHFLATSSFVRRGLAPALPLEAVLPTAVDVEQVRRQREL